MIKIFVEFKKVISLAIKNIWAKISYANISCTKTSMSKTTKPILKIRRNLYTEYTQIFYAQIPRAFIMKL